MPLAPLTDGAAAVSRRLADYVVLSTSPHVPLIAADYWELSVAAYGRVHAVVTQLATGQDGPEDEYRALVHAPDDCAAHRALAAALAGLLDRRPDVRASTEALIAEADSQIWIDYWLGASYTGQETAYGLDLLTAAPVPPRRALPPRPGRAGRRGGAAVNVIIPFRDADRCQRTRNLLACLRALRDQDFPADRVRVVVVETDAEPYARDLVEPMADRYLHAYNDALFNKSWAVNLGLRDGGEPHDPQTPPLTCVLDADILVERAFLSVNTARFDDGHDAHLPYRDMLSLDGPSSDRAIRARLDLGVPAVDAVALRGLLLRETPGACLWARTEALHRIGGFDERFEGWGGEDDDVTGRLARSCSLVRFDDPLLHLDHPRPQMARGDGQSFNGHLAGSHLSADAWTAGRRYGDPDRFLPRPAAGGRS